MEQKTEASQAVDDLDALAKRLDRIHTACTDDRPKQAVGEMIHAMINMPEWDRVRAALKAQPAPTEAAQGERLPAGSIGAQEFLNWNRRQPIPLVAIPMEMGVYRKAIEIHLAIEA